VKRHLLQLNYSATLIITQCLCDVTLAVAVIARCREMKCYMGLCYIPLITFANDLDIVVSAEEEIVSAWSKLITDWEMISKRRQQYIRVSCIYSQCNFMLFLSEY